MIASSSGVQLPALSNGGGFMTAKLPAALSQFNPATFAADLVTPYVQGIKAGSDLMAPVMEAVDYISPVNKALRAAKIAIAKSQTDTAQGRTDAENATNAATAKNAGPLSDTQLDTAKNSQRLGALGVQKGEALIQPEIDSDLTMFKNKKAMGDAMNKAFSGGGADKIAEQKMQEIDNQSKALQNQSQELDNQAVKIQADKTLAPQEIQNKTASIEVEKKKLDTQIQQLDMMRSALTKPAGKPLEGMTVDQNVEFGALNPVGGNLSRRTPTEQERAQAGVLSMAGKSTGMPIDEKSFLAQIHRNNTGVSPYTEDQSKKVDALNKELEGVEIAKGFDEAAAALSRIKSLSGDNTGASDLQLVDLMNQIVNKPGIKVTEGNVDLIKSAMPKSQKWNADYWVNNIKNGSFLTPDMRKKFSDLAGKMVGATATAVINGPLARYRAQAQREGIDAEDIGTGWDKYAAMFKAGGVSKNLPANLPEPKNSQELLALPKGAPFLHNGKVLFAPGNSKPTP